MTRTAATARVAGARDFGDGSQFSARDLALDSAFGNKKARADQRFVTGPIVARGVAVLPNRSQQRVTGQFRTVLSAGFQTVKTVVHIGSRSFGRAFARNSFSEQRR